MLKCITIIHSGQWILFIVLQYRLGFFFWEGEGGETSDLNVLSIHTDTIHASDKRLIAKFGLELVGSLLPQISIKLQYMQT